MSETLEEVLVGIPSLSPNTCMRLLEVVSSLRAVAAKKSGSIQEQLLEYAEAAKVVCSFSVIHQRAIIGKLEVLIKGESK